MSDFDPTDLEGQAERQQAARERAERAATVEGEDFKWLMSSKRGRRIVWRQLDMAGVFRLTFTGDALTSAFNEGQRNIGLKLVAQINSHAPDQYQAMLAEAKDTNG